MPTIRVDKKVYDELVRLTCKLTTIRGRRATFNDAIKYLLEKERGRSLREGI